MSESFSYLNPEQRESLKALPFPVLLPNQLPESWSVKSLNLSEDEENVDFELTLTGPSGSSFDLLATNGGVGDALPGDKSSTLEHPLLETLYIEHYLEEPEPKWFQAQWIELLENFSYAGFRGRSLSDEEASALINSLEVYEPAAS